MLNAISGILDGYAQGYFLMADPETGDPVWYGTHERTLIPLDHRFHIPRSLRPILSRQEFRVTSDQAFEQVVEGCADRSETWISDSLKAVYQSLHRAGWAHSFETWAGDQLAGGILGITLGSVFIGESMFYRIPNGSKVAMVKLVEHLNQQGFTIFDAQLMNPHLERFGAYKISQESYLQHLKVAIQKPCRWV